jgi:aspartyl-tRNA(Asn)/glutamyl-tRNA(Gln) amidotransferase subunit C
MAITRSDVARVAHLARLGLTDAEMDHMAEQLSQVLDAMQSLNQLDTSAIPPTAQVIPLKNVMRDDVARPSSPQAEILRNAPAKKGDYFLVPTVLDE